MDASVDLEEWAQDPSIHLFKGSQRYYIVTVVKQECKKNVTTV
jgi:hypothetical protein